MNFADFSNNAAPDEVTRVLHSYWRMLDGVQALRAHLATIRAPLRERILLASLQHDVEAGIASAQRWLSRRARRGVSVEGAGRSPARPAGPSMAHGCAASAVGGLGPARENQHGGAMNSAC